jgi:hypothetical protein
MADVAPWEDAVGNYASNVGSALGNLWSTATSVAPWEAGAGMVQAAGEAGSGLLHGLNSAVNDLLPGSPESKSDIDWQIQTDPVLNYHPNNTTAQAATDLLGQTFSPISSAASWANNQILRFGGEAAAATAADLATLATGEVKAPWESDLTKSDMTTYHGSPHIFSPTDANPLGEFDLSKMGTGEGAQAYGHGIYVAENQKVAQSYTGSDGTGPAAYSVKGQPTSDPLSSYVAGSVYNHGKADTVAFFKKTAAEEAANGGRLNPDFEENWFARAADMAQGMKKSDVTRQEGNFYHVDVPDEHVANMLDWDKPLAQQPDAVQGMARDYLKSKGYLNPTDNGPRQLTNAFKAYTMEVGGIGDGDSGGTVYGLLSRRFGGDAQASQALAAAGVPGAKYLDDGSRQAGRGTRNYVLYDPSVATITKRIGPQAPWE